MVILPPAHLTSHSKTSGFRWVTTPLVPAISVLYCAHLSMKCSLSICNIVEVISSLSHSTVFLFFFFSFCIVHLRRLPFLALLFSSTLHLVGYIFPFLFCLLFLFFSQMFVWPPQTTIMPFSTSFSLAWFWSSPSVQCYKPLSIVLQTLFLTLSVYLSVHLYIYFSVHLFYYVCTLSIMGFPGVLVVKNSPAMQMTVQSLGWEDPLEKKMKPTPVFLPRKSQEQTTGQLQSTRSQRIRHKLAAKPPLSPLLVYFIYLSIHVCMYVCMHLSIYLSIYFYLYKMGMYLFIQCLCKTDFLLSTFFWFLGSLFHCKLSCLNSPYPHRSWARNQFNLLFTHNAWCD